MRTYRWGSTVQALCYLALVASITISPPPGTAGQVTVFDRIFPAGLWAVAFATAAVWTLGCAAVAPGFLLLGHLFLFSTVLSFGVANLGTSLINGSGWQIASLSGALAVGHLMSIRMRPLGIR